MTQQNETDDELEDGRRDDGVALQRCVGASGEVMKGNVDFEDVLDRLSKGVSVVGPPRETRQPDHE